jgi:hypothetical protein
MLYVTYARSLQPIHSFMINRVHLAIDIHPSTASVGNRLPNYYAYILRHDLDAGELLQGRRSAPRLPGHIFRLSTIVPLLG